MSPYSGDPAAHPEFLPAGVQGVPVGPHPGQPHCGEGRSDVQYSGPGGAQVRAHLGPGERGRAGPARGLPA